MTREAPAEGGIRISPGTELHLEERRGDGRTTEGLGGTKPIPPSQRQRDTLNFVIAYMDEHGVAPSRTEVASALGVKTATVDAHLVGLMKKGWVELKPNQARYIKLLRHNTQIVRAGTVAPEEEMLAEGRVIDEMARAVALRFEPTADCFVAMHDESMSAAGVRAGDLIAVRIAVGTPASGEIAVVRTGGEITLRRVRHVDERHVAFSTERMQGADVEQIVGLDDDEVRIEGIMVGALIGRRPPALDPRHRGISEQAESREK